MNKINYSLLSALYDTQDASFYSEIFFPIIKYGIASLSNNQEDTQRYYDLESLQTLIYDIFGISIPLIVLKQTIKIISQRHSDFTISELYGNGDQFKITKVWDASIGQTIERRFEEISKGYDKLNILYERFISVEKIETQKKFLDFLSDNTLDILNYFNTSEEADVKVNEEYIHIVRFLQWLQTEDVNIFSTANTFFWGSIVAAFLLRDKDINIKPALKVNYYLDSSLVMAAIDLGGTSNVLYARELIDIITSSGNNVVVHPLTIREINTILYSVEVDQMPRPNSGIAEAYYRRELSPSKILHIRLTLNDLIRANGMFIEPISDNIIDEIQATYKNKSSVLSLKETRGNSYKENIRDIHDVYMPEFVNKKRGHCFSIEKCNSYFVSLNLNLINHYKTISASKNISPIIHPSKIITDLWMHNSSFSILKQKGLTEVISRCIALNQTDVRRKLRVVARHFNENEYTEEKYKALYLALIDRSSKVVAEVDEVINENNHDEHKIKAHIDKAIALAIKEEIEKNIKSEQLQNQLNDVSSVIKVINNQHEQQIIDLKQEYQSKLDKFNRLYQVREKLLSLEKQRDESLSLKGYWFVWTLELCTILVTLTFLIIAIIYIDFKSLKQSVIEHIWTVIIFFAGLIFLITKINNLYILPWNNKKEEVLEKQIKAWKKKNELYAELLAEKRKIEQELGFNE